MSSTPNQLAIRSDSRAVLGVIGLLSFALLLRWIAAWWWQMRLGDSMFGFGDSDSYWHLAEDIARGRDYMYGSARVFRAPGYPLLLTPLFWIWSEPPVMAARIFNGCLGVLPVWLAIATARRIGAERSEGYVAGLLAAVYPGAIAMSVFVLSEAAFAPLMMCQLYFATRLFQTPRGTDANANHSRPAASDVSASWALLVGVAGGLATLVRPSWLLFTPALAATEIIHRRFSLRAWRSACLMAIGICLVMSPWWIRNYRVTGAFVPTTLQIGASLMDGLGPQADGSSDMRFVDDAYARLAEEDRITGADPQTFEIRLNNQMRDDSLQWAKENPQRVAQLAWIKLQRIWNPWPNSQQFQSTKMRWLIAAGYVPLLMASLLGLAVLRRRPEAWLLALPAVYLTSLHVIFVGSIRYRQPAMLAMTPIAACGMAWLWRRVLSADALPGEGGEGGAGSAGHRKRSPADSRGAS